VSRGEEKERLKDPPHDDAGPGHVEQLAEVGARRTEMESSDAMPETNSYFDYTGVTSNKIFGTRRGASNTI
jgi:hypothetical protein